ncbi:hypothetical protein JT358_05025 [Micrococcales bacterium 31B]|nr:hypothetical protein [Micrococcales bacterium 31B]
MREPRESTSTPGSTPILPEWPSAWRSLVEGVAWQVSTSGACTVIAAPASDAAALQALATDCLSRIATVFDRDLVAVRIVLPPTSELAGALTGNGSVQEHVAITTTFPEGQPWLVLDPSWWVTANATERTVTLLHECTHALMRADVPGTPRWLSEGIAQWASVMTAADDPAEREDLARQLVGAATVGAVAPADTEFYDVTMQLQAYATSLCMVRAAVVRIRERRSLAADIAAAPHLAAWQAQTAAAVDAATTEGAPEAATEAATRVSTGRSVAELAADAPNRAPR